MRTARARTELDLPLPLPSLSSSLSMSLPASRQAPDFAMDDFGDAPRVPNVPSSATQAGVNLDYARLATGA